LKNILYVKKALKTQKPPKHQAVLSHFPYKTDTSTLRG